MGNKKRVTCFATLLQNDPFFVARQVGKWMVKAQHRYSTRFAAMLQNQ